MPRMVKEAEGMVEIDLKGKTPKYMMNISTREIVGFKRAHLISPLAGKFIPYNGPLPPIDPATGTVRMPDMWTGDIEKDVERMPRDEKIRLIAAQIRGMGKEDILASGLPSKLALEKKCGFSVSDAERKEASELAKGTAKLVPEEGSEGPEE